MSEPIEPQKTAPSSPVTFAMPKIGRDQARWLRLWSKSEDVAMHFNDLILNFRMKALGAVTIAAGLLGTLLRGKEGGPAVRADYLMFAAGMVLLLVVWLAIAAIDLGYYRSLLRGAVKEAIRLETMSGGAIQLSDLIKKEVDGQSRVYRWSRALFYILPAAAFIAAARVSWWLAPAPAVAPVVQETRAEAKPTSGTGHDTLPTSSSPPAPTSQGPRLP